MKNAAVLGMVLTLVSGAFSGVSAATIEDAYQAIHSHICTEVVTDPCPPSLDEVERWAYVTTWCKRNDGEPACAGLPTNDGPAVLAFHHDGRSWRPIAGIDDRDVESNVNDEVTALTNNGRVVVAVVESTNPLVYTAEASAIAENPSAAVASIQELLAVFGPALRAMAQSGGDGLREEDALLIAQVLTAASKIKQCLPDQLNDAKRFVQLIEDGRSGEPYQVLAKRNACPQDSAGLGLALDDLRKEAKKLSERNFCPTELTQIREWLNMPPTDVAALRQKQKTIVISNDCHERFKDTTVKFDAHLGLLEKAALDDLAKQQQTWRQEGVNRRDLLQRRLGAVIEGAGAAVAAANALLTDAKRTELEAMLVKIQKFDQQVIAAAATTAPIVDGKFATTQIADFFVVPRGQISVAWRMNRARTLTVKKASILDGISTNRPDTLTTKYTAGSLAASLIATNVSLIYTELASPVFGMVSEAAPTAADPNARRNVIAQTDEEGRSGDLAVLISLPIFLRMSDAPWARRLGLELGAGTDT